MSSWRTFDEHFVNISHLVTCTHPNWSWRQMWSILINICLIGQISASSRCSGLRPSQIWKKQLYTTLLSEKLTTCSLRENFFSAKYSTLVVGLKRFICLAKGSNLFTREFRLVLVGYVRSCVHRLVLSTKLDSKTSIPHYNTFRQQCSCR